MKCIKLILASVGFIVLSSYSHAQGFGSCKDMFPGQAIPKAQSNTVQDLCKSVSNRAIFAIRYDTTRKIPIWTAHKLTPAEAKITTKRKHPSFKPDPKIDRNEQAKDDSYKNSGFSRGHIIAAADMRWSLEAYRTTFLFSNVVPQMQKFNAGVWLGMENEFRKLVVRKNINLWDYSGVYGHVADQPNIGTSPNNPIVPKCFYKIFVALDDTTKKYKVLAALYHWNDFAKQSTWTTSITTLAQIKIRTGINFLAGLTLEDTFDAAFWGVKMPDVIGDCS